MKNLPETASSEAELLLEDYLDHYCAPLIGVVAYRERQTLREEIREHLYALVAEYEFQGLGTPEAVYATLREMGEPWIAGSEWLVEWNVGRQTKIFSSHLSCPFAFFGIATMLNLLLLEQYVLTLDGHFLLNWVILSIVLSPVIAGICTGWVQAAHLGRNILYTMLILAGISFVTGLLLLPKTDGIGFAALQLVLWLPAGIGSAHLTAYQVRFHRRHRFLRVIERS